MLPMLHNYNELTQLQELSLFNANNGSKQKGERVCEFVIFSGSVAGSHMSPPDIKLPPPAKLTLSIHQLHHHLRKGMSTGSRIELLS